MNWFGLHAACVRLHDIQLPNFESTSSDNPKDIYDAFDPHPWGFFMPDQALISIYLRVRFSGLQTDKKPTSM